VLHRAAGEGRPLSLIGGNVMTCKARSADTGGAYALFENVTAPGGGPPLHVHRREEEAFYLLEGELVFTLGGRQVKLEPGAFLLAPRGLPHTFVNPGAVPSKALVLVTPGGLEDFFDELSRLPSGPPDVERLLDLGRRHGIELPGVVA
jgi:mannose-6-phosphate isomerase-like protein (cupin superfamily)